jgi:hypothetical protein
MVRRYRHAPHQVAGCRIDTVRLTARSGVQEHLEGAVLLLLERLVGCRCIFKQDMMGREAFDPEWVAFEQQRRTRRYCACAPGTAP